MSGNDNLLLNPAFRYGQAVMSALLVAAIGFYFIEDTFIRAVMLLIAAVDLVVTPQVLKRAGQQAASDA